MSRSIRPRWKARIRVAPRPVTGSDGKRHLAYELQVTSHYSGDAPLKLTRLAIFADGARVPLKTIEGAELRALLGAGAAGDAAADGIPIADGASRTLFLWLAVRPGARPASAAAPADLPRRQGAIQRADDVRTPVIAAPPVRIGPPCATDAGWQSRGRAITCRTTGAAWSRSAGR